MSEKFDRKHEVFQSMKFTLFSISAGIIQFGTNTFLLEVLNWAPWVSYLIGLILSVLWNFTFNRKYTFRSDADIKKSMKLVVYYYLVFTPVSTLWTAILTGENPFTGAEASPDAIIDPIIVLVCTMLINFITEFLYQKFVVYRNTIDTNDLAKKSEKKG